METLYKTLLILHILAGTLTLITGPAAMMNRKGGKQHRLTGKVFFYAMMLVAATAVTMASMPGHHNPFLLIVGVFSAYLVSSGYRVLYLKGLSKAQKPQPVDWALSVTMAAFALYFIYTGIAGTNSGSSNIISVAFGSIALLLVMKDLRKYTQRPADKYFWLYDHITRMVAGTIAAYTAFLVVNNTLLPPVLAWLGPTVLGTAVISYFIRKYKMKARAAKDAREVAVVKIGANL